MFVNDFRSYVGYGGAHKACVRVFVGRGSVGGWH